MLVEYIPWNVILLCCAMFCLNHGGGLVVLYPYSSGLRHYYWVNCPNSQIPEWTLPYHTVLHSEQIYAHFCDEWSIVGYGSSAFWDLWNRFIILIPLKQNWRVQVKCIATMLQWLSIWQTSYYMAHSSQMGNLVHDWRQEKVLTNIILFYDCMKIRA